MDGFFSIFFSASTHTLGSYALLCVRNIANVLMFVRIYTCMLYMCMCVCVFTCVYVRIYVCVCVCVCVCYHRCLLCQTIKSNYVKLIRKLMGVKIY